MVDPGEITWELADCASVEVKRLRGRLGNETYERTVKDLREFLSGYFSADPACKGKQGSSISPLGGTSKGGKKLKVRWALPGDGKSGGLRLAVIAYCRTRRVVVAGFFPRRAEPSDEDFEKAFGEV